MHVRAMENWGCITFADYVLLVDPITTPTEDVHRNSRSICHEIAHMWFGNLVTMEWWDDIWLNEGFARHAEHIALEHCHPEYKIWNQYITAVYKSALD
jgi:puromycin-sensitive aminopeptidase